MPSAGAIRPFFAYDLETNLRSFLYRTSDFAMWIEGGEILDTTPKITYYASDAPPEYVVPSHELPALSINCGSHELDNAGPDKKYRLPSLEAGEYELLARWHGQEIGRKYLTILPEPTVRDVSLVGAVKGGEKEQTWYNVDRFVRIRIDANVHPAGPRINIFLNGEHVRYMTDATTHIDCNSNGTSRLQLRSGGKVLWDETYNIVPFPPVIVTTCENPEGFWKGSHVYRPESPPEFEVLIDDGLPAEAITCSLGLEPLACVESNGGYMRYALPAGYTARGQLRFNARFRGYLLTLHDVPEISIVGRPDVKIKLLGSTLGPGTYSSEATLRVRIVPCAHTGPLPHNIVTYLNGEEFTLNNSHEATIPGSILTKGIDEMEFKLGVYWYQESLAELRFRIARPMRRKITLVGGIRVAPEVAIYHDQAPPRIAHIEGDVIGGDLKFYLVHEEDKRVVEKLELSTTLGSPPNVKNMRVLSLGEYNAMQGSTWAIQLWQGEVCVESKRFGIANPRSWKKLSYYDGQVATLSESVEWKPCWMLHCKRGSAPEHVVIAGNCPPGDAPCPCERVSPTPWSKDNESYRRALSSIANRKVKQKDRARWNSFYKGGEK